MKTEGKRLYVYLTQGGAAPPKEVTFDGAWNAVHDDDGRLHVWRGHEETVFKASEWVWAGWGPVRISDDWPTRKSTFEKIKRNLHKANITRSEKRSSLMLGIRHGGLWDRITSFITLLYMDYKERFFQ